MDWEIPPRGKSHRTICCETSRISSHLLGIGAMASRSRRNDCFLYTFTSAENFMPFRAVNRGPFYYVLHTGGRRDSRSSGDFIPHSRNSSMDSFQAGRRAMKLLTRNRILSIEQETWCDMIGTRNCLCHFGQIWRGSGIEHELAAQPLSRLMSNMMIST